MKTITYKIRVVETGETREFDNLPAAEDWVLSVRQTLGVWGGNPHFEGQKITTETMEIH